MAVLLPARGRGRARAFDWIQSLGRPPQGIDGRQPEYPLLRRDATFKKAPRSRPAAENLTLPLTRLVFSSIKSGPCSSVLEDARPASPQAKS